MNADFWDGKEHTDRFYPLFSIPQRNMIKKNNIAKLKELFKKEGKGCEIHKENL